MVEELQHRAGTLQLRRNRQTAFRGWWEGLPRDQGGLVKLVTNLESH